MKTSPLINEMLTLPFAVLKELAPSSAIYSALKSAIRTDVESLFSSPDPQPAAFGPFGDIVLPFFSMGNISSLNLFDIDEILLFNFYWFNKGRYRNFVDMGANIGLHSIIAAKCGYSVRSIEPDPIHFERLQYNLSLNRIVESEQINAAVSIQDGELEFCRVKGNTTGSHLSGAKKNPYGELDYFPVKSVNALPLLEWADLVKMDIEGHEATVLQNTDRRLWEKTDAFVEIENQDNAALVFKHFRTIGINLFSQKKAWKLVEDIEDMPFGYKDGSLFITSKDNIPWQ